MKLKDAIEEIRTKPTVPLSVVGTCWICRGAPSIRPPTPATSM